MKVTSNIIITSRKKLDFGEIVDHTTFKHERNELASRINEKAWKAFVKWCDKNKVSPDEVEMYVMESRD